MKLRLAAFVAGVSATLVGIGLYVGGVLRRKI